MANWLKQIFGGAAADQEPATTTAQPAPAVLHKHIWAAIAAGDVKDVADRLAQDPQLLHAKTKCAVGKRSFIDVKPFHLAAQLGKLDILQLLHDKGADLHEKADKDYNALILAARSREKSGEASDCVRYILAHSTIDVNDATTYKRTALTEAAVRGNAETLALLIQHGACNNPASPSCVTALVDAATMHHTEIVATLLDNGVSASAADYHNRSALWWALHTNGRDTADLLMARGANVTTGDKDGVTPLIEAAYKFNLDAAKKIIAAGANINQPDNTGNTPLHWVTFADETGSQGHDMVELLLAKGAWIDIENSGHRTPEQHAKNVRKPVLAKYLENKAKDPATERAPSVETPFKKGSELPITTMKKIRLRPAVT